MDTNEVAPDTPPPPPPDRKIDRVLDRTEFPLRVANRLLAGLPFVGKPWCRLNGQVWEILTDSLRRR